MWLNAFSNLLLGFFFADVNQVAVIGVTAPQQYVVSGRTIMVQAQALYVDGAPADNARLQWTSSDPTIAQVNQDGEVRGIGLGVVDLTVRDQNSGVSSKIKFRVLPSRIEIEPADLQTRVGETVKLSAKAYDADGKIVSNAKFKFRAADPAIAGVSTDGSLTPIAEGIVSVIAELDMPNVNFGFSASAIVRVLRKPDYKLRKILTADTTAQATIVSMSNVTAPGNNVVAGIATLSTGGQAAMLWVNGNLRVLAATGQMLENSNRLVLRVVNIAANSRGDAAVQIDFPHQWCGSSVLLFKWNKPEVEIASSCTVILPSRAISEDGAVTYTLDTPRGRAVQTRQPDGTIDTVIAAYGQPTTPTGIRAISTLVASRTGTAMLYLFPNSGSAYWAHWDGKQLKKVFTAGDTIGGKVTTGMDEPVPSNDGKFYTRFYGNGYVAIAEIAPAAPRMISSSGATLGGTPISWVHFLLDARDGAIAASMDLTLSGSTATQLALVNDTTIKPLTKLQAYNGVLQAAVTESGNVVANVLASGEDNYRVQMFGAGGNNPVFTKGDALPINVPLGLDWRYLPKATNGSALTTRSAGDAVVKATTGAPQTMIGMGTKLPNNEIATWIGGVASNRNGDILFSAGYRSGSGFFYLSGGKMTTIIDTLGTVKGPGVRVMSYTPAHRGRYLAVNNKGEAVFMANFGGTNQIVAYKPGDTQVKLVAGLGSPAPGGGNFSGYEPLTIDELGRIAFLSTLDNGRRALFFYDGSTLTRVIGTTDRVGPGDQPLQEFGTLAASAKAFHYALNFGDVRELRTFDGGQSTLATSSDFSIYGGARFSTVFSYEHSAAGNGDVAFVGNMTEGVVGVFAHKSNGTDAVVARSSEKTPDGDWILMPFSVAMGEAGEVYFGAYIYNKDGKETLALYQATPQ